MYVNEIKCKKQTENKYANSLMYVLYRKEGMHIVQYRASVCQCGQQRRYISKGNSPIVVCSRMECTCFR
ncbi:hypothetical protein B0T13DRAFT_475805 [Neurospora crassa]|nr:hypothetical protein B0T13DRAFT_475805 [Neurospora crassa]